MSQQTIYNRCAICKEMFADNIQNIFCKKCKYEDVPDEKVNEFIDELVKQHEELENG